MKKKGAPKTIRSDWKGEEKFAPVKVGEILTDSEAWNDLHAFIHYFGCQGLDEFAPPGIIDFMNRSQDQAWVSKPLKEARVVQINAMLNAASAAYDDPELFDRIRQSQKIHAAQWRKEEREMDKLNKQLSEQYIVSEDGDIHFRPSFGGVWSQGKTLCDIEFDPTNWKRADGGNLRAASADHQYATCVLCIGLIEIIKQARFKILERVRPEPSSSPSKDGFDDDIPF